ncbi:hypothetical protein [Vibrio aestuarianus]|nr:hypothetical protein [Vibrio aestuarianus]MDE1238494.1 hypothetical protein [Vibrio aestuarianus]
MVTFIEPVAMFNLNVEKNWGGDSSKKASVSAGSLLLGIRLCVKRLL